MANKKSTKKALFMSAMSLLLCFSMLIGTTFAWFTDSVSSTNNIIKAGNLDVELYWSKNAKDWEKVTKDTNVFEENTLWEPGHTEVVYLKVVNEGSLALKYNLGVNVYKETVGINVADQEFKLSDFIMYDVLDVEGAYANRDAARAAAAAGATKLNAAYANASQLLKTGDSDMVALVVYMPETVDNAANYKTGTNPPVINLGIDLFATQYTKEQDSYGPDYDANASVTVTNFAELKQAIKDVKDGGTIYLEPGLYEFTEVLTLTGKNVTIHGMGGVLLKNIASTANHFFNVTEASTVVFRNLEMDGNSQGGKYGKNGVFVRYNSTVTLENCQIYSTRGSSICIDQVSDEEAVVGKTATVNLINTQIESVVACAYGVKETHACYIKDAKSYVHFNYDGKSTVGSFSKDDFVTNPENILINGSPDGTGKMVAEGVWLTAPKTYAVTSEAGLKNLEAVLTAAKPGEGNILNVELMCDVDLSGDVWNTIDCMWIVFNGNGHTISNINCGKDAGVGRSGFWGYAGAVTINDLTLENVTSRGTQAGTFAGSADGLKLNNCVLKGTNVVTWEQNAPDAYQETASGIGAITGVTINSNLNVEIASGATVTLNLNGMTTILDKVDNLVGHEVPGYAVNSGNIVNNGKIVVTASSAADLQFAMDTATIGENYIVLAADITGNATVTQKDGVKITIDGKGYNYKGVITVDGKSARYETAALTIQNVNFSGVTCPDSDVYPDAYIRMSLSNASRYTTNVTVKDCTFSGTDKKMVAVKSYTGGDWNVTLDNLTVDAGMHSLAQLKNVEKGLKVVDCKVYSKNGLNVNNGYCLEMDGCTFDVQGYAVRFGSDAGVHDRNFSISNSTLKSACADGDPVIEFRKGSVVSTLTLTNTKLEGTTTFKGNTAATTITVDGVAVKVAASQSELESAVASGNNVNVTLSAGDYDMPTSNLQGKTVVISGTKETVIDVSDIDTRNQFVIGTTLVFDGVTLEFNTDNGSWIYMGFANVKELVFRNCDMTGLQMLMADKVTFENCKIDSSVNAASLGQPHSIWTYSAKEVNFIECDFIYGDRAVNVYLDNGTGSAEVNFTNCTFTTTEITSKGAIEINSSVFPEGISVNFVGCTAPEYGTMVGISGWDSTAGASATITVDGTKIVNPIWAK